MRKMFERLRNLKVTKHYIVIHTNKNTPALKSYIVCFNICHYKRDITSEMVSYIMGQPTLNIVRVFVWEDEVAPSLHPQDLC